MPRPQDDAARREVLNRKLRQAFYEGAAKETATEGHALDNSVLMSLLRRYPWDV